VFKVNGTTVGTATGATGSVAWDSTSTSDGPVSVTVEATDVAGNGPTASPARVLVVDNHPPTVTLDSPSATSRGTVALNATTSPDTTQVTFQRSPAGAGTWATIAVDTTAPFATSLDTTTLSDGSYDLRSVATDDATPVTSNVRTTLVDNTSPAGAVTIPVAGATIGGPTLSLHASAADGGSDVSSVQFRVDGTSVATVTSAPWAASWDASSTSSGAHALTAVVTDAAGNTFTTANVSVTVDSTPPTVTLADPGTPLSGLVTVSATSPDGDTAQVAFERRPAGGSWTTIATDTSAPYAASFQSAPLADGEYDFRAVAADHVGNSSAASVAAARRLDNTPPSLASSSPADGSTLTAVSSVSITASEALSAVTGVQLDGGVTTTPVVTGSGATFVTGPLADGPHTLSGTLVDLVGKSASFATHFTIVSGASPSDWPYVEMSMSRGADTTLHSSDGQAAVTMRSGTYSSTSDQLVVRIDPGLPASLDGTLSTGLPVYDITSSWSLTGAQVHTFSPPLEIVLANPSGDVNAVPATFQNGTWRPIPLIAADGLLPFWLADGYFVAADGIHVVTTHLSEFTVLHDGFSATVAADGLTLRWLPGADTTGAAHVQLYVGDENVATFDATQFETKIGPIAAGDPRVFTLTDTDRAGNASSRTVGLRALPKLAGLPLADATSALVAAGFAVGTIATQPSTAPAGTVLAPSDVRVLALGSHVDLVVAETRQVTGLAPLVVRALGPVRFDAARLATIVGAVASTRAGLATVELADARGKRLQAWRTQLSPGVNHPQLRLLPTVRRLLVQKPRTYWLTWTVTANGERRSDRARAIVTAGGR
jgi:hypothetical protein